MITKSCPPSTTQQIEMEKFANLLLIIQRKQTTPLFTLMTLTTHWQAGILIY
jgi:hypothetical protein